MVPYVIVLERQAYLKCRIIIAILFFSFIRQQDLYENLSQSSLIYKREMTIKVFQKPKLEGKENFNFPHFNMKAGLFRRSLLSLLLRYGTRPYKWGNQWDWSI